jgi:predicted enzyme related to lactoylglutathione lyase
MLRGMSTVNYYADDVTDAGKWYAELLGIEPYFRRVGPDGKVVYLEFRIGDYQHELGIIDRRYANQDTGPTGEIVYWCVDDLDLCRDRLLSLGAKLHEGITVRGDGLVTASVIDPFGNLLGIMLNSHYFAVLEAKRGYTAVEWPVLRHGVGANS